MVSEGGFSEENSAISAVCRGNPPFALTLSGSLWVQHSTGKLLADQLMSGDIDGKRYVAARNCRVFRHLVAGLGGLRRRRAVSNLPQYRNRFSGCGLRLWFDRADDGLRGRSHL